MSFMDAHFMEPSEADLQRPMEKYTAWDGKIHGVG
jgi:hypothetical protein